MAGSSGGGGFDRRRLTWLDLEVWQRLKGFRLSHYEMDLLMDLDAVEPANALKEADD